MSCALTSGYALTSCGASAGGVEVVWALENSNTKDASGNTLVLDSSGTVTGMTVASGTSFKKIEVPPATANTSTGGTGSQENGTYFYTHTVVFPLNRRDASTANLVRVMAKNRLTFITKEKDGVFRLYGKEQGLGLDTSDGGSGTAAGDRNGYLLTFSSIERDDFLVVAPAVATSLGLY